MSIEKMNMLNMIGHIDEIDKASKLVVLSSSVHLVSAIEEMETANDNKEMLDNCCMRPYDQENDYASLVSDIKKLKKMCSINIKYEPDESELILDYGRLVKEVSDLKYEFSSIYDTLVGKKNIRDQLLETLEHVKFLNSFEIPLQEVENLNNYSFEVYKVAKEKILRLKENYENIPSIVISVSKSPEYEVVISFTPKILKAESDKIFKSLNCERIVIPHEYKGKPREVVRSLNSNLLSIKEEIASLTESIEALSHEKGKYLVLLEKSVELELKAQKVKKSMARSNEFFYLGGWIPEGGINGVSEALGNYDEKLIMVERSSNEVNSIPPTRLKNNLIVRPFEAMVNMYGVPSYLECDPTTFLGISYMLLFGAMFGDLGQGVVLILAGIFLKYKKYRTNLGPILVRLGVSSSIFGFVYGSCFGFENVIPALVIRPMESISEILIYAIIFGCLLSSVGFIYGIVNNIKKRNLEDGIFGKGGAAGFILYLSALTFVAFKFLKVSIVPSSIWIILFLIPLIFILFKQPLCNLLQHKRPLYTEEKAEYYMEGTFGILEFLLGMFSNTVSFVRVGAFALNHVGLFLAFETLAKMTHNRVGGALMYILGNLVILGIEGLIVFIQAMRLEYYELFSKYYEGEGVAFEPIKLAANFSFDEGRLIKKIRTLKSRG